MSQQHQSPRRLNTSRDIRLSNESIGSKNRNSGDSPPSGQRVVVGRETTPTPTHGPNGEENNNASNGLAAIGSGGSGSSSRGGGKLHGFEEEGPTRIPKEVWARFESASREVRRNDSPTGQKKWICAKKLSKI